MHLGKHEHTLLAFKCCPFPCFAPDSPGRSAQGCSCWPLGHAGDPAQAPELALARSVTFLTRSNAGCNENCVRIMLARWPTATRTQLKIDGTEKSRTVCTDQAAENRCLGEATSSKGSHEALALWMPGWNAAFSQGLLLAVVAELSYCQRTWLLLPASPDLWFRGGVFLAFSKRNYHTGPWQSTLPLLFSVAHVPTALGVRSG